jgi:hypothetical protein
VVSQRLMNNMVNEIFLIEAGSQPAKSETLRSLYEAGGLVIIVTRISFKSAFWPRARLLNESLRSTFSD